jgi:hypothetical protein
VKGKIAMIDTELELTLTINGLMDLYGYDYDTAQALALHDDITPEQIAALNEYYKAA